MQEKKFSLLAIAIYVALGILALFGLISMIDGLRDNDPFIISPIGSYLVTLLYGGLVLLITLKGKPLVGAVVLLLTSLWPLAVNFMMNLLNGTLDFSNTQGFASLLYLGAVIFIVVAFIIELKTLDCKPVQLNLKLPFVVLLLIFFGYGLLFLQVTRVVFIAVLVLILHLYDEGKFIPWLIATVTLMSFFRLVDDIIYKAKFKQFYTILNTTWISNVLGIAILVLSVLLFFIPNLLNTPSKPKEAVDGEGV